jgi:transcriptional regulator with XRE-family HTH domain
MTTPPDNESGLPEYLRELRAAARARKLHYDDLALRVRIGKTKVNAIMNGARASMEDLAELAKAVEISPLRILTLAGRIEGINDLVTYIDQLEEQASNLERAATVFMRMPTGVSSLLDTVTASGRYGAATRPRWLVSEGRRVHYEDTILLQPLDPTGDLATEKAALIRLLGAEMAWFGAGFTTNPQVGAGLPGSEHQLAINVPRFLAIRRSTGRQLPGVPRSIAVIGGHWAGSADVASLLGHAFDYDYSHVSFTASRVYARLTHEPPGPTRDEAREEIARTYISGADLGRRRTWAADSGDNDRTARLLAQTRNTSLCVVYLRPTDELIEWTSIARHRLSHHNVSPAEDAANLKRARTDVERALARILQRTTIIDAPLPPGIDRHTTEYVDDGDILFECWWHLAEQSLRAIHSMQPLFDLDEARSRMREIGERS